MNMEVKNERDDYMKKCDAEALEYYNEWKQICLSKSFQLTYLFFILLSFIFK